MAKASSSRGDGDLRRAGGNPLLRAAEILGSDVAAGAGGNHLRAGDKHLADLLHRDDHVGQLRHKGRAARAGPEDQGDLRNHAGEGRGFLHDARISVERLCAFVQIRACGIGHRHNGRACLARELQQLDDLLGRAFTHGAALDGEILRIDEHRAILHRAVAGDDAAGALLGGGEHTRLDEAALVKELVHALARGQFAGLMLFGYAVLTAAAEHELPAFIQFNTHCAYLQTNF